MRVLIVGGGGFRVPLIHRALTASRLPLEQIVLQDVSTDRLNVIGNVLSGGDVPVRTTTDLDEALDGTDLVFSAVRVGGVDGRVSDERAALDLGLIGQETVGAGGLLYAARAVPVAADLARRIATRAPDAWTLCMTNPAGIITETMSEVLGDRVIGVCDSPAGLIARAARALQIDDDYDIDYIGLNHLGWLRALRVGGVDRLPDLLNDDELLARTEEGRLFGGDLVRALGALPNEYLYWYYARAEALQALRDAGPTRGEHVRAEQRAFYRAAAGAPPAEAAQLWSAANDERNRSYFAELRDGARDELDVSTGGYEGIAVGAAEALSGMAPARLVLNVRNAGTVPALDDAAVIETVCDVDEHGAHPRPTNVPALDQLALMAVVKACERAIAAAATTGSTDDALRAFATHPLVGSSRAARELARRALTREPSGVAS